MKRLIFITLVVLLLGVSVYAAVTQSVDKRPTAYWWSGNPVEDKGWIFLQEVETILEAWTIGDESNDIITFPTNGATIDNATNGRVMITEAAESLDLCFASNILTLGGRSTGLVAIDFNDVDALSGIDTIAFENGLVINNTSNNILDVNENDDEMLLTFGSNTVTMSGDLTSFSFGTIPVDLDQFISNSVTYTLPTADGGSGEQLTTNASGVLSWAAAGAGAGNTLNQAYDQGGGGSGRQIDADDGAVVITTTDADAAFMLSVTPTPGSSAATGGISITSGANSTEDSLQITNSGSGFSISADSDVFTVASDGSIIGLDLDVTGAAGVVLQNDATITNAVDTEIKFLEGGESLVLDFQTDAVQLQSDDGVVTVDFGDVDALTAIGTIAFDAAVASITQTADAGAEDFTISQAGGVAASLILSSAGTPADALQITTTAGGIDVTNGGAAGGEDLDLTSTSASLTATAGEDVDDAIVINASAGGIDITADGGATTRDLDLVCTNGSINWSSGIAEQASTTIASTGGIDMTSSSTYDITLTSTGGKTIITGNENAAGAITLTTAGAGNTAETIIILNDQGSGDGSISIDSTAGGMDVDVAQNLGLASSEAAADAVVISASAGGVDITSAGAGMDTDITASGGKVIIIGNENAAGAVTLATTGAGNTAETIHVNNDQGTSVGEGTAAIQLITTAGGICFESNANLAKSIQAVADGGVTSTIYVQNDTGTGAGSIELTSDVGGVIIEADTLSTGDILLDANDTITLSSNSIAADGIYLHIDGGTSETIKIRADQGTGTDSIHLLSDAGGITINTGSGGVTFSDDAITNVGDFSCDDIIDDASSDIMYMVKTVIKTIDVNDDDATDDFLFDNDVANQNEQSVDMGALVPAYAELLSAQLRCFETLTGSGVMAIDVGTASGGAEVFATANIDSANDISATAAAAGPEIVATAAAKNIWINATPGANWDTLSQGRWAMMVTYIDYGAVYTQRSP